MSEKSVIQPPEFHWKHFPEFIRNKLAVGEPSPHMKIVGHLSKDLPVEEQIWRAGCYAVPYSIISAEVIWTNWPLERALADPEGLAQWVRDNWKGIHTRTERRCVRTPAKFNTCLLQYAEWVAKGRVEFQETAWANDVAFYDGLWQSITTVKFMGRYISIRLVELLRRYVEGFEPATLYDIRSIGGWSPRLMLSFLVPERADEILGSGVAGAAATDEVAEQVFRRVKKEHPDLVELDYYVYAAMLCEYREAAEDGHQYPARTHDQEIEYLNKFLPRWPDFETEMLTARKELFPAECLGEIQGWEGVRHDLSHALRDHELDWSDLKYDYVKTTDLAEPVTR